jgi:thiosulfate/3-mercaptopyruvate sulfurtransferase
MSEPIRLPGPVVDAGWLADHLDEVVVADVRWYLDGRSGRAAYEGGHLPGAVFVDLDTDLSAPPDTAGGRHPLPSPERFAAALGRLGIGPDTPVVAYDDAGGSIAARLWWLRHLLGEPTAVLDGGLTAWSGELPTDAVATGPVARDAHPWPEDRLAGAEDVEQARIRQGTVIIDARAAGRYQGEPNPADPRPGHVPGALSAPWVDNLDPGTGRFRPPDELRARFAALGGPDTVIAYCGSGVTACHDLLALELAGRPSDANPRTRLFPGSWSAWAADPSREVETGPGPGPV